MRCSAVISDFFMHVVYPGDFNSNNSIALKYLNNRKHDAIYYGNQAPKEKTQHKPEISVDVKIRTYAHQNGGNREK